MVGGGDPLWNPTACTGVAILLCCIVQYAHHGWLAVCTHAKPSTCLALLQVLSCLVYGQSSAGELNNNMHLMSGLLCLGLVWAYLNTVSYLSVFAAFLGLGYVFSHGATKMAWPGGHASISSTDLHYHITLPHFVSALFTLWVAPPTSSGYLQVTHSATFTICPQF